MNNDNSESTSYQLVATRLQEPVSGDKVRCNLCLWHCQLHHGQRGFCQAHVNRNGTLYNLSYGILSAIDIGPIEDKPVKHFRPGTTVMSVGSYGCSFRCGGCHNLEISWGVEALDELARGESTSAWVSPEKLVEAALRHKVDGIAFTYSEPAVWLEYVLDVSKKAHEAGLYTVYVSNSFVTDEALELMAPHLDVLCSDIKSFRDDFYQEICRPARVEQVLASIEKAHQLGIHVETRTNVIPGKNDDPQELRQIAEWIAAHLGTDSPWHITRFFPAYKLMDVPATPSESLWAGHEVAIAAGLENVYVYDDKGCDCATTNLPLDAYLEGDADTLNEIKKCSANCCDDEGILLKKYERERVN
ncbi:MAG TPA: AmmeMemoRadiSam system radical SAM enzyme [Chromatiales bacterium]|nr:AmmeMemoRadiSam system radical SAM enzyme [Chromatiales bacterium]HIO55278.1 AmmeMemoRadiSam system radical SAM enzyme [Chromatiales bacterium]